MKRVQKKDIEQFYRAIVRLRNSREVRLFLRDLQGQVNREQVHDQGVCHTVERRPDDCKPGPLYADYQGNRSELEDHRPCCSLGQEGNRRVQNGDRALKTSAVTFRTYPSVRVPDTIRLPSLVHDRLLGGFHSKPFWFQIGVPIAYSSAYRLETYWYKALRRNKCA